jgi:ubiquinone/menaquinone biosynthesis C-methylase UbiE
VNALKQRVGRSYARFATNVAVRFPRLWPLVRPLVRKQFDLLAPVWDSMRSPDAFSPLAAALGTVEGPVEAALDVGTGTGAAALEIAERFPAASVVGVDIAREMVERAKQKASGRANLSFEVGDASALRYDEASFDLVTAANMIPFFDELARVVRPGGTLVVAFSLGAQTPIYVPSERMRKDLGARGFAEFADIEAGRGTALVARKR